MCLERVVLGRSKSRRGGNFNLDVYCEKSRSYGQEEGETGMWGSKGAKGKGEVLYLYDSKWNQSFRTSAELDTRSLERNTHTHTFSLSLTFVLNLHEVRPPVAPPLPPRPCLPSSTSSWALFTALRSINETSPGEETREARSGQASTLLHLARQAQGREGY
ncbi:hypothetical protein LZ32DRAFT_151396 [Colletotrichum eremochloae]|nr:hypothetical protein LZ32DRAFT_151396 [Colletotrichum eremochloae]